MRSTGYIGLWFPRWSVFPARQLEIDESRSWSPFLITPEKSWTGLATWMSRSTMGYIFMALFWSIPNPGSRSGWIYTCRSIRTGSYGKVIRAAVPDWSLAKVVTALMALRGIDLISATGLLAELGDLSRFQTAPELMGYLGMGCSESSTGDTIKRGPITKTGNRRARRTLVECAWSYQHPPRIGIAKQEKVTAAPPKVREIAWKAQSRLNRRYRALIRRGKLKTVAITAVARELAGFVWAIAREAGSAEPATK